MPSNFFAKVQGLAVKSRVISRNENSSSLNEDDIDLFTDLDSGSTKISNSSPYDNSANRGYENPKRQTGRSARTEKRTFGYQLPINFDDIATSTARPVRRVPANIHYRRNRLNHKKTHHIYFDIVK